MRSSVASALALAVLVVSRAIAAQTPPPTFDLTVHGHEVDLTTVLAREELGDALGLAPHAVPTPAQVTSRAHIAERYITDQLLIFNGGLPCPGAPQSARVTPTELVARAHYACTREIDALTVEDHLLFALDPHREAGTVVRAFGVEHRFAFRADAPVARFVGPPSRLAQLRDDVRAGALAWAGSVARMAFLAAVLLYAAGLGVRRGVRHGLGVLAAFSLAQTVALALVTWRVAEVPARGVAGAIAASVVYLAVENVVDPSPRWRWVVAGVFGAAHGLGYAAAWGALHVPARVRLATWTGFEVGVIAAQLAMGALVFVALVALRRATSERFDRAARRAFSIVIAAVGVIWLVRDVFGR